jgi:hypothetical protein
MSKKRAKRELLALTIMLWAVTPIAFLSIPVIGIVGGLVATFSTLGYLKVRQKLREVKAVEEV